MSIIRNIEALTKRETIIMNLLCAWVSTTEDNIFHDQIVDCTIKKAAEIADKILLGDYKNE